MVKLKRSECSILHLVLKRKWFEMIERGEKRQEYRAFNPYWEKRIENWYKAIRAGSVGVVEFRLGYGKRAPRLAFLWCELRVVSSSLIPEWGEPEETHYLIGFGGERVELED